MQYTQNKTHKSRPSVSRKTILLITCLALVLGGGLLTLELTDTTHLFHEKRAKSSTIPSEVSSETGSSTTGETDEKSAPEQNSQASASEPDDKSSGPALGGAELTEPTGSFVSNHRPSLGSTANSSGVESVCTTTPGASCSILFTKDGVTKTLGPQKTNSNGTVIWNWDVKEAGFTAGTWQIKAVATLDGQAKEVSDPIVFEVQP